LFAVFAVYENTHSSETAKGCRKLIARITIEYNGGKPNILLHFLHAEAQFEHEKIKKNFQKKLQKVLDKAQNIWHNKNVK